MMFSKRSTRVAAEAEALAAGRHPGVVELVEVAGDRLRTTMVDGARPLSELGPLAAEEIAGLLASVATTVADLHDRGVVHGGLDAGHVLVRPDGRPVLCSLGRGGEPAEDVAALGRLVAGLLATARPALPRPAAAGAPADRRGIGWTGRRTPALGPMLTPAPGPVLAALVARATAADPAARPAARELAAEVHRQLATARLPVPDGPRLALGALRAAGPVGRRGGRGGGEDPQDPRPGPRRGAARVAARVPPVAALAVVVAGALVVLAAARPAGPGAVAPATGATEAAPGRAGRAPAAPATTVAAAVAVWPRPPVDFHGGVLTVDGARYEVGRAGDEVALGDWACTGRTTAALLRPGTGEVFAFDGWPPAGGDAPARPLGRVDGGLRLRAVDRDGDGCDEVEVTRREGPPVALEAGP